MYLLRENSTQNIWIHQDADINVLTAAAAAKSLQSCPTLCDPIDGSTPGSAVPGILQARTLEWVAISFSNTYLLKEVKWKKLKLIHTCRWQPCVRQAHNQDDEIQFLISLRFHFSIKLCIIFLKLSLNFKIRFMPWGLGKRLPNLIEESWLRC